MNINPFSTVRNIKSLIFLLNIFKGLEIPIQNFLLFIIVENFFNLSDNLKDKVIIVKLICVANKGKNARTTDINIFVIK